ncbi:MAG: hypothetical protein AB7T27_03430 [Kiritimatiellia bacterium]
MKKTIGIFLVAYIFVHIANGQNEDVLRGFDEAKSLYQNGRYEDACNELSQLELKIIREGNLSLSGNLAYQCELMNEMVKRVSTCINFMSANQFDAMKEYHHQTLDWFNSLKLSEKMFLQTIPQSTGGFSYFYDFSNYYPEKKPDFGEAVSKSGNITHHFLRYYIKKLTDGPDAVGQVQENRDGEPGASKVKSPRDLCKQAQLSLSIDRTWIEDLGDRQYANVLVTWENKTSYTFDKEVAIQAVAYDAAGKRVGENVRSFFTLEWGPIEPNFKGTLTIGVELHGADFAKMICSVVRVR